MILEKLAQRGHLGARRALDAYNENQPRDERGRWGEGASGASGHAKASRQHEGAADEHAARGEHAAAKVHRVAAKAHRAASLMHGDHIIRGSGGLRTSNHSGLEIQQAREKARAASVKAHEESAKVRASRSLAASRNFFPNEAKASKGLGSLAAPRNFFPNEAKASKGLGSLGRYRGK